MDSIPAFVTDIVTRCDVFGDDVAHQRMSAQDWNSIRGGYSVMLRAVDMAVRSHKLAIPKNKLLK